MLVELSKIDGAFFPFDIRISPDAIELGLENVRLTGEISAKGQLTKHIVQTDIAGTITAPAEIDCTRCLDPISQELEIPFEASYISTEHYTDAKEAEIRDSELDISVFDGERIDLNELVREQILLAIPEQIFCRPDCKGLCPKCGEDLNLVNCSCKDDEIDPRWSALESLK